MALLIEASLLISVLVVFITIVYVGRIVGVEKDAWGDLYLRDVLMGLVKNKDVFLRSKKNIYMAFLLMVSVIYFISLMMHLSNIDYEYQYLLFMNRPSDQNLNL